MPTSLTPDQLACVQLGKEAGTTEEQTIVLEWAEEYEVSLVWFYWMELTQIIETSEPVVSEEDATVHFEKIRRVRTDEDAEAVERRERERERDIALRNARIAKEEVL